MKRYLNKTLSLLLSAVIAVSLSMPCCAVFSENDTDIIEIKTAEDFSELAKKCKTDTYSRGKTVMLTNDIDLSKNENCIIPTFGGVFDGGGYTISGVKIDKKGSYIGLFRYLQEGGEIKNLNVLGTAVPQGSEKYVGGIVGENSGKIENSTFCGNVAGDAYVGGICGSVTESGIISGCDFDGSVTGKSYTGGICGQNNGYIKDCKNNGGVNTTDVETEKSIQDLDINIEEIRTTENIDSSTDTGGICGFSKGTVIDCENYGDVGYPSVGYNTGGICGRQSGVLLHCKNYGTINGRKDIGGICGQAEPYILLEYTEDILNQVDGVLSRIRSIIDSNPLLSDDLISDSIDGVGDSISGVSDSAKVIKDDARDYADGISDSVNDFSDRLYTALDSPESVFNDIELGGNKLSNGAKHFKSGGDCIKAIADDIDNAKEPMEGAKDYADKASTYLSTAMRRFSDASRLLDDSIASLDVGSQKLYISIKALSEALKNKKNVEDSFKETQRSVSDIQKGIGGIGTALEETIKSLDELKNSGQINGDITASTEKAKALAQCYKEIAAAISDISDACLILGENFDIYSISSAMNLFSRGFSSLSGTAVALKRAADNLEEALNELEDAPQNVKDFISELQSGLDDLTSGVDYISDASKKLSDIIDGAAKGGRIKMPSASDVFGEDFNIFSDKVSAMRDEFSVLKNAVRTKKNDLNGELDSLSGELGLLSDILSEAYDEHIDADENGFVEDISEENIAGSARGKIEGCRNEGEVYGDVNGGGIVGSMAIEYDFDPEDDIKNRGEESLKFTYKTKCVVIRCKNSGAVEVKKDYGGGITGRMNLGSVLSCENYGNITNTDGNYTGGIAGLSDTAVRNSVSKCDLSGNDYIGGITGKGAAVSNCYTLVNIKEYGECVGAVSGSGERADMENNFFVASDFGAIDDINYTDVAEETDITAFAEFVKTRFNTDVTFTLTFMADEKEVGQVDFAYKSAIPPEQIPKIPKKKGYYGKWSEYDFDEAKFDAVITAEYYRDIELIGSDMKREGGKSVLLLCGAFDDNAQIRAESNEQTPNGVKNAVDSVSVNIENVYTENYTVRYLPLSEKTNIYIEKDGKLQKVSAKQNGSYLEFETDTPRFTVYEVKKNYAVLIFIGTAAIFICAVICLIIRRKRLAIS